MIVDLSILNANLDNIEGFLKPLLAAPILHMDIMDGKFVKETSFDEKIVKRCALSSPRSIIDCHLMVENPIDLIDKYKDAGANYITFHYEVGRIKETIDLIHSKGLKAGISINPGTDVKVLEPYLKDVDMVLIMSVWPGRGGQSYIDSSTDKLKYLKEYKEKNNLHYLINVDGGINMNTYELVKPYADLAVVGSAITKAANYVETYYSYLQLFMNPEV